MGGLTQSYTHGASAVPLLGETIGVHFDKTVERWPNTDALVARHQGVRWTYRELQNHVNACAAGLLTLGLEPGDRLGIWSPNNAEWVVTQFAAAKAGIILVSINPAYRLGELEYVLKKVGCKALIVAATYRSRDYVGLLRQLAPELDACRPGDLRAARVPALRVVVCLDETVQRGMVRFADLPAIANANHYQSLKTLAAVLQFDDPINIQFTSGTTGTPKGATLTHHNILNNGFFVGEAMRLTEHDRLCIPVPLYHCFGMVLGNLACVTHGAAMIYPTEVFQPLAVLETVVAEHCTALHGVPTMFIAELNHPDFARFDLSSLRTGIMAGAPCPIEVMKRVRTTMHMEQVTIAYGMTETSPVIFQSAADDPVERRVCTVGRVQPHIEVKIVDSKGRLVPPGVPGELLARGYAVMQGYWDEPARTAEAIDAAGWMHTGDLATLDADGYGNIVGRIKDTVIRGGENIYPREIEEFLYKHPKVQGVQVFGVPDAHYGEELCAWILLREGAAVTPYDIKKYCLGQIAHYKIPHYIKFVDTFPMTVTGKVQKFVMREQMIAELGLEEQQTA